MVRALLCLRPFLWVTLQVHVAVATRKMPQGVRTFPEILELAQAVQACPSLRLRGVMTHGGDYEVRPRVHPRAYIWA